MRYCLAICLISALLAACVPAVVPVTPPPVPSQPSAAFTPVPTLVPPSATSTPQPPAGIVVLDFISLLCNAQWSNGAKHLTACTPVNADHSGGFADSVDPTQEGLPAGTPVLLTIPAWNGASSLFLRYPSLVVSPGDRFQATLLCRKTLPCDVQFALEYYDASGKYHSPFMEWNFLSGDAPIRVDADLSALAGQAVDLVLVLRLFHALDTFERDNGLWIQPQVFRPGR